MKLLKERLEKAVDDGDPFVTLEVLPHPGRVAWAAGVADGLGWRVVTAWESKGEGGHTITNILLKYEAP